MNYPQQQILRLGTRGSLLARMQSQGIADTLTHAHPGLSVHMVLVQTTGDRVQNRPLNEIGGKGLFTKEIEQALLADKIDVAVHSFKDVPITMPLVDVSELLVAAVPVREDASDVLIGANSIENIPSRARVGTSSLRRKCQLLALRPDLQILPMRGNIDSRLRKLRQNEFDVIVLAAAGLKRSGLYDPSAMYPISFEQMLPAAGQGASALQCRAADLSTCRLLEGLNDPITAACVELERQVVRHLNGDCHSPIAALAEMEKSDIHLRIALGQRDGQPPVHHGSSAGSDAPMVLSAALAKLASAFQ